MNVLKRFLHCEICPTHKGMNESLVLYSICVSMQRHGIQPVDCMPLHRNYVPVGAERAFALLSPSRANFEELSGLEA